MTEETIAAGEFKAKCLKMMADVERTSQPLIITKRGKPLVKIVPYIAEDAPESAFGCMKGTAELLDTPPSSPSQEAQTEPHQTQAPLTFSSFVGAPPETQEHEEEAVEEDVALDEEPEEVALDDVALSEEPDNEETENSSTEDHKDVREMKKPLPISRTPPPNRGLPLDNPALHRQETKTKEAAPSSFSAAPTEAEDELYIPSIEEEQVTAPPETEDESFDQFDDFLLDEEDEDVFDTNEEEDDDDEFFFSAEEDDMQAMNRAMSDKPEETASSSPQTGHDVKQKLEWQFTSAWNRHKPQQGEDV